MSNRKIIVCGILTGFGIDAVAHEAWTIAVIFFVGILILIGKKQ
jgi:hypothetical protein